MIPMARRTAVLLSLLVIVLVSLSTTNMVNGLDYQISPPLIRFTGILYPLDEEPDQSQSHDTLLVWLDGEKKWIFVVEDAQNLSRVETKLGILKDIFPPRLYFHGTPEAVAFLQNPESAGKRLRLLGYLHLGEKRFDVMSIDEVTSD